MLSRIGEGSRVVLTHDVAQRDNLRVGRQDGVVAVVERLKGHPPADTTARPGTAGARPSRRAHSPSRTWPGLPPRRCAGRGGQSGGSRCGSWRCRCGEGQPSGGASENDVEELEADPCFGGVRGSSEVESLGPGSHTDGDIGKAALGFGCDVVFVDELFKRGGVFMGEDRVVAQPGDDAVCACAGECLGDPALDVSDSLVLFLQVAQALVARQEFSEPGAVEPEGRPLGEAAAWRSPSDRGPCGAGHALLHDRPWARCHAYEDVERRRVRDASPRAPHGDFIERSHHAVSAGAL